MAEIFKLKKQKRIFLKPINLQRGQEALRLERNLMA